MKNKKPEPKVLFSRNRLVLTSENNLGHIEPRVQSKYSLSSTLGTNEDRYKKTKTVYTKVNRRYESPLGFYYYKKRMSARRFLMIKLQTLQLRYKRYLL